MNFGQAMREAREEKEMFDEQPDGDPHGECAAEIPRLEIALKIKTEEHDCCAEDVKNMREAACTWWEGDDGGPWATQCNELFNIENEGPEANGMRFCCFCGKKLVEVASDTDEVEKWKDENL